MGTAAKNRCADRRIAFWRGGDGNVYFKGGVILYLIYVAGFVARLSIDIFVLGPNALTTFSTIEMLTSTELYATIATDLLLMFGLLIGRNTRIIRRCRLIKEGKETLPDSPSALKPIFGSKMNEQTVEAVRRQLCCFEAHPPRKCAADLLVKDARFDKRVFLRDSSYYRGAVFLMRLILSQCGDEDIGIQGELLSGWWGESTVTRVS